MNRAKIAVTIVLLFATMTVAAQTQHPPSTAAERDRLVKLAAKLQADPLNPAYEEDRAWAMKWIEDIPDITINLCDAIYSPMKDAPHGSLLAEVFTISATAFIIQHPDKAQLDVAVNEAGVEGMLQAYQIIVARAPKQKSDDLDDLLSKEKAGTLERWVSDQTLKCSTNPRS